jgi:spore photoproduct lyase
VAKLNSDAITDAPDWYGHNNETSYFLKTSLNCIFNCSYCFLKWAFKNDIPVYFINYDYIKKQIIEYIKRPVSLETGLNDWDYELKLKTDIEYKNKIWFYSSDYSDILWMDNISGFIWEFVEFFEKQIPLLTREGLGVGAMMEIRTKSGNIKPILDLWFVPKNTEFAFSLNPQELIDKYEHWTSNLDDRINAINILLDKGYKVWLRFLPLLPVKNYEEIYTKFVEDIKNRIEMKKISSTFVSGLLYTKWDYNNMLKKYPKLDILYRLQEEKSWFIRENREMRNFFYTLFESLDKKCFICLDEK